MVRRCGGWHRSWPWPRLASIPDAIIQLRFGQGRHGWRTRPGQTSADLRQRRKLTIAAQHADAKDCHKSPQVMAAAPTALAGSASSSSMVSIQTYLLMSGRLPCSAIPKMPGSGPVTSPGIEVSVLAIWFTRRTGRTCPGATPCCSGRGHHSGRGRSQRAPGQRRARCRRGAGSYRAGDRPVPARLEGRRAGPGDTGAGGGCWPCRRPWRC